MSKKSSKYSEYSCEELAVAYQKDHDEQCFSELIKRIKDPLFCYISSCKILNDTEDVKDAVSITYESMLKGFHTFNPEKSKFITWAYTIGRNSAIHVKRDKQKQGILLSYATYDDLDEDDYTATCMTKNDNTYAEEYEMFGYTVNNRVVSYSKEDILNTLVTATSSTLEILPVEKRMVLKEKYINHKKMSDISVEYGIPISSVKNWLRVGKSTILERFKENDIMYMQAKEIKLF